MSENPSAPQSPPPAPPKLKRQRRKPLPFKQQRFVEELVKTGSPVTAVERAYPGSTPKAQAVTSHRLLQSPKIRSAIDELLAERYPDLEKDFAKSLSEMLAMPLGEKSGAAAITPKDRLAVLQFVAELKGYKAPTETRKLVAKLSLPKE